MILTDINELAAAVLEGDSRRTPSESLLVALSGIDASGKGHVARQLVEELRSRGLNAVVIGLAPWLNRSETPCLFTTTVSPRASKRPPSGSLPAITTGLLMGTRELRRGMQRGSSGIER